MQCCCLIAAPDTASVTASLAAIPSACLQIVPNSLQSIHVITDFNCSTLESLSYWNYRVNYAM